MVARNRKAQAKLAAQPVIDEPQVIDLTPEESQEFIEREVRNLFGIMPEEFLRRWHAGEITNPDRSDVVRILFLFGLA